MAEPQTFKDPLSDTQEALCQALGVLITQYSQSNLSAL